MDANEYQKQAAKTIGCKNKIDMGIHGILGFMAEHREFELADEIYKSLPEIDPEYEIAEQSVIKEAGDMWWMIAEIATANDLTLKEIMEYSVCADGWYYPSRELCGIYQKYFQGHEIDRSLVLVLLAKIAQSFKSYTEIFVDLGFTSQIWEKNIESLKVRYPESFTIEE